MRFALLLAALAVPALAAEPVLMTAEKADALLDGRASIEHRPGFALSKLLGLPTSEKKPSQTTFYALRAVKNGTDRTLSRAKGVPGWLFTVTDKNGARYVRVDEKFKTVGTAQYKKGETEPRALGEAETGDLLASELAFWGAARAPKRR